MINMIIGNFLLLVNLCYFSNELLKKKHKNKIVIPISIFLGVLILVSRSYPSLQLYGTFIMISYYILFELFLFNGKVIHKLFIVLIFVVVASISEILSANVLNLLFGLVQNDLNTILYAFALILSNSMTFAFLGFIAKCIQLNTKIKLPISTWLIFALPLSTFLLLINLTEYFATFRNNMLIAPILIGLLIANFITIYIFFQTINTLELKNQINNMQIKYDTINTLYQNNFNFLHDTIWKLNDIYKDINSKQYDNLSNQVEDLSNNILKKFNVINTNSNIISSILNFRLSEIINNNIEIKSDIIYNNFSFLPIQIQAELFSTIINDAIDSCLLSTNKSKNIIIRSEELESTIVFRCIYTIHSNYPQNTLRNQLKAIIEPYHGKVLFNLVDTNIQEVIIIFNEIL